MNIDVKGITITLTKEQVEQINKQSQLKLKTINDLNSYEDACEVLLRKLDYRLQEISAKLFAQHVIETIIEAANFIDNNYNKWKADFTNKELYKYIPYWEKDSSGWVVCVVFDDSCYAANTGSGFYFKSNNTARTIAERFIKTYNIYLD